MIKYTVVSHEYLRILIARGWRMSEDLMDEFIHSGYNCHDVIIHNSGEWKDTITGLK